MPSRALLRTSVAVGLVALCVLLSVALWLASENYGEVRGLASDYFAAGNSAGVEAGAPEVAAKRLPFRPDLPMLFALNASRAQDMLFFKGAALIIGFAMVLFGCLFVLTGIQQSYKLSISQGESKSALKTSSPGLVLISLGSVLVVASLTAKASLQTNFDWGGTSAGVSEAASQAEGNNATAGEDAGETAGRRTEVAIVDGKVETEPATDGRGSSSPETIPMVINHGSSGSSSRFLKLDEFELQLLLLETQYQRVLELNEDFPAIRLPESIPGFDLTELLGQVSYLKELDLRAGAEQPLEVDFTKVQPGLDYTPAVGGRKALFDVLVSPNSDIEGLFHDRDKTRDLDVETLRLGRAKLGGG
ncbi:MAG: hypothetical protein P1V81_15290 [Planctomycetota bacterium]|nr:hypothetical protein [Planctomycetota bacterium]